MLGFEIPGIACRVDEGNLGDMGCQEPQMFAVSGGLQDAPTPSSPNSPKDLLDVPSRNLLRNIPGPCLSLAFSPLGHLERHPWFTPTAKRLRLNDGKVQGHIQTPCYNEAPQRSASSMEQEQEAEQI